MFKYFIYLFLITNLLAGCSFQGTPSNKEQAKKLVLMLEGVWLDKLKYQEQWFPMTNDTMKGEGAYMKDGKLQVFEYLRIVRQANGYIYEATVLDQNEGQTVSFPLVAINNSMLIFENRDHDFPNRISYLFISDSSLKIRVESLSDTSRHFEQLLVKQ